MLKRVKTRYHASGPQWSQHYENSYVPWDHSFTSHLTRVPAITPVEAGTPSIDPRGIKGCFTAVTFSEVMPNYIGRKGPIFFEGQGAFASLTDGKCIRMEYHWLDLIEVLKANYRSVFSSVTTKSQ